MELLREKNYQSPNSNKRMIVCEDMREWNYPAPMYDRDCRHFYWDKFYCGRCELNLPMCNCRKDCYMSTSSHDIHYPTTKERG